MRFCCGADGNPFPIFYRLGDDNLTLAEYNALSDAEKAAAKAIFYAALPEGFNENSSIDDITELELPNWGAATQQGYSVLPEESRDSFSIGFDATFGEVDLGVDLLGELRNTITEQGYVSFAGESLNGRSPFNPFGRSIHLRGQRQDLPQPYTEAESTSYTFSFDVAGPIGDRWDWEGSLASSSSASDTTRNNTLDGATLRTGMGSDGVTPITEFRFGLTPDECAAIGGSFNFGLCVLTLPPVPAINPFGDISAHLNDALNANSSNSRLTLEGLVRGELFDAPGGTASGLIGIHYETLNLESSSEFAIGTTASPIGDIGVFDSDAERANNAFFSELSVPLVGKNNAFRGVDKLILSLSVRNDSYDTPEATYIDEGEVITEDFGDASELSETSWGVGLVWGLNESWTFRLSQQSAFVAPQLNQLLRPSSMREASGFAGLIVQEPNGVLSFESAIITEGGNPDLLPETAETSSLGIDLNPAAIPGLGLKVTFSTIEYVNRINRLTNPLVDRNDLPSNTQYDAENDIFIQERRWINVSTVDRSGVDYELVYGWSNDSGDFDIFLKRSVVNTYDFVLDPSVDEPISVVRHTEGTTAVGVVPEKSTNAQFVWRRGGLEMALDVDKRGKSSSTIAGVTSEYSPPSLLDLTLSYTLSSGTWLYVPKSLDGARITFVCNNLLEQYGSSKFRSRDGESLPQTSSDSSPLYGRVFSLSFTHLFPVSW